MNRRKFVFGSASLGLAAGLGLVALPSFANAGPIITVKVDIGRKSLGCTKFGVCSITIGAEFAARGAQASATVENRQLVLQFHRPLPASESVMPVDEDIKLGDRLSKALGVAPCSVVAGSYKIERNRNQSVVRLQLR